ncbi:MAG: peptidyl-prolyl cis-trans isomerase [Thiomargarita sp.]|nr:peptidyl-prolyl cis-trans isomerase [Thiomargarita sp.]
MKYIINIALLLFIAQASSAETQQPIQVNMQTSAGTIVIQLNQEKAPKTVANFLTYVNAGFYDGTIFHRIINNFMIQGGGFTPNFQQKTTNKPIANEANNGLKNVRGSIAMARTGNPHSATSQFFININDNAFLDYKAANQRGWGYTVFGKVVEGMEIVNKIKQSETGSGGPFRQDVPKKPIIIEKVSVVEAVKPKKISAE